ncbi:hypothetical protein TNCV_4485191 [Trichonephila clavipes]|nr:hypothetical protein TNCV_4485191 [Trichonephila clavipes]
MVTSEQKAFCVPQFEKKALSAILLYNECSSGHLRGHVNTHNERIWGLKNPHVVLESQQDSPKLYVFCAICL